MQKEPLYIIGDVHGCFDTLCALVEKLPKKWDSKLIFVGDLIDRGPKSCEVIDLLIQKNYACVLGNHEELMLEYYHAIPSLGYNKIWISNGGYETMESYKDKGGLYKIHEHLEWLLTLPRFLLLDYPCKEGLNPFITHGFGLPFFKEREEKQATITWNRLKMHNLEKESKKNYGIFNIFGHDVQNKVLLMDNFAAIDTGCVYHKKLENASLSAIEWPSKKIYSQKYCG
ncbi:metallophosphoesterase [Helicobacter burdigaliensis]|uniref:metallophosphoesterase n=1 Tax=Helicobacter burdigaliensis TaxID=2315334 RepID=UPI000EF725FF|nr:metallophosphoesterase [Helicobacter burdigaliensis]